VLFLETITGMLSWYISSGLAVEQSCFSMILAVANHADFAVATRKFSNEMKSVVETLCCFHCSLLTRTSQQANCAQCTLHTF